MVLAADTIATDIILLDADSADATRTALSAMPGVADVALDVPTVVLAPTDPLFANGTQYGLRHIQAPAAWEFSIGQAVVVAVVDSGIDLLHPEFAGRILPGYNFVDDDADVTDGCGHGTHVAGIVAAAADGVGTVGIAHAAFILPVKVIGDTCGGSYSRLIQGILFAADAGADIIVITSGATVDNGALKAAVSYARDAGSLVVVAAGNGGDTTPFYPGSYLDAYTVAGTDADDAPFVYSTYGSQIDIAAPAVRIVSTSWSEISGSTYLAMTGTSMAAPHVAGVAALVLALYPDLQVDDLEAMLSASADDLGDPGRDSRYGHGRVNALNAVTAVRARIATEIYVGDIDAVAWRKHKRWKPEVEVTAVDGAGNPISDVTVIGGWSDGKTRKVDLTCQTDATGRCRLIGPTVNSNKTSEIGFSVQALQLADHIYASTRNTDPDGDSNGSTIFVDADDAIIAVEDPAWAIDQIYLPLVIAY